MSDDVPEIDRLEADDSVRVEYISKRSRNPVEREGEVTEVANRRDSGPIVYVHDGRDGFFSHTFVALVETETTDGDPCVAAISVSTAPEWRGDEPPRIGEERAVKHAIIRRQTLGVVSKVIRFTEGSLTPNDVL